MDERLIGDLYLLGALRLRGIEPVRTTADGGRAAWAFLRSTEVQEVVEQFYARRLPLDALTYSEAIRAGKAEAVHLRGG